MITTQIDYRNLQFLIYQDGKPVDNPLTAEVQRVVILKVIEDAVESLRNELRHQLSDVPPGLSERLLH